MKITITVLLIFISLSLKSQSLHIADSLYDKSEYTESIEIYSKLIESDSLNADLFYKRGSAFQKKNKFKKAYEDYNTSIKLDSTNGEVYAARSFVRYKLGNNNGAISDKNKAEELGISYGSKDSYTASNRITYAIGDTIKLGMGSNPDGEFRYINIGGWGSILMATDTKTRANDYNIGRGYAHLNVTIKKIKRYKFKGGEKVYFVIAGGNITNYNLYIEEAIASCEVEPCGKVTNTKESISIPDELLKASKLLSDGLITKEEFDIIKKKLLEK
jgi:tetratricopeptide (TPR) repeat protein